MSTIIENIEKIEQVKKDISAVIVDLGEEVPSFTKFGKTLSSSNDSIKHQLSAISSDLGTSTAAIAEISSEVKENVPLKDTKYNIFVFGDSTLSFQISATTDIYAHVLSTQIVEHDPQTNMFSVFRIGHTGDQPRHPMYNSGAHPIYLKPFTLKADKTETVVSCEPDNGWNFSFNNQISVLGPDISMTVVGNNCSLDKKDLDVTVRYNPNSNDPSYGFGLNPVTLNGIKCHIRRYSPITDALADSISASNLYIKAIDTLQSDMAFDLPVRMHTAFETQHTMNDVVVLFIGTNDEGKRMTGSSTSNSVESLIFELKETINSLKTKKYIVVGPATKGRALGTGNWNGLEFRMGEEFGCHYVNTLYHMVNYGLKEANLPATEQDLADIAANKMPTSLRADSAHMNSAGYQVLGKLIYRKGVELGYWK